MITGDNLHTSIVIAKEMGIIKEGEEKEEYICMHGPEFNTFVGGLVNKTTGKPIDIFGTHTSEE